MDIIVECEAGTSGEAEPRAFTFGATRFPVLDILDRWPGRRDYYFKVLVPDGRRFVLRHEKPSGRWELAALVGKG